MQYYLNVYVSYLSTEREKELDETATFSQAEIVQSVFLLTLFYKPAVFSNHDSLVPLTNSHV